jgi:3-oxoacyl-(acyl-carrier-protein) synthase
VSPWKEAVLQSAPASFLKRQSDVIKKALKEAVLQSAPASIICAHNSTTKTNDDNDIHFFAPL